MGNISFVEWVRRDIEKQGFIGADIIGRQYEVLANIPSSLQQLVEDALYSNAAKRPLLLYIESLRDMDEEVQRKKDLLVRFLVEAKQ
ncbi:hypothetical protein [Ectobacillus sp. sgz5001026]|uniref:hypothetical protein n=1 Tax=Ectobacillus sp. sgz5001026 TaxID=3242473 RepID=UPI0036D3A23E